MSLAKVSNGFKPIAGDDALILILGSFPGQISLAKHQYYAQSRNQFWRITGSIFSFSPEVAYKERTKKLKQARVALWDVCASALRRGSLDSAIRSVQSNKFSRFFKKHRHIRLVCFNGRKAEQLYRRYVLPGLTSKRRELVYKPLPSSSSAYAAMRFKKKLKLWRAVLTSLNLRR